LPKRSGASLLIVSYIIWIVIGVFFLAVKLMKRIYFLCGPGKNNEELRKVRFPVLAAEQTHQAHIGPGGQATYRKVNITIEK
jgi:hypothetical protein